MVFRRERLQRQVTSFLMTSAMTFEPTTCVAYFPPREQETFFEELLLFGSLASLHQHISWWDLEKQRLAFFCFLASLGFELRASRLLGRHITSWATPQPLCFSFFFR
jgi:hypothetical protein